VSCLLFFNQGRWILWLSLLVSGEIKEDFAFLTIFFTSSTSRPFRRWKSVQKLLEEAKIAFDVLPYFSSFF